VISNASLVSCRSAREHYGIFPIGITHHRLLPLGYLSGFPQEEIHLSHGLTQILSVAISLVKLESPAIEAERRVLDWGSFGSWCNTITHLN
jgi:hypothetical protein